jgi:hypothetical protein
MSVTATCHCGQTRIELPHLPTWAKECNCSFCHRTGAVWGYFGEGELKMLSATAEKTYSASGGMNLHHFCANCGIQTWGDSPDWASMYNSDGTPKNGDPNSFPTARTYAVNLRLVDELDLSSLVIEKMDGRKSW